MKTNEQKDQELLAKLIIGQILNEYDRDNNIAIIKPVIPKDLDNPECPINPLDVIRTIFESSIRIKKADLEISFSLIDRYQPLENGMFKIRLSQDFLRFSGNKEYSEMHSSRTGL